MFSLFLRRTATLRPVLARRGLVRASYIRAFCRAESGESDEGFDPFAPDDDMGARLAQAEFEAKGGRMQAPAFLDDSEFADDVDPDSELLLESFKVVVQADKCPGCGVKFQTDMPNEPGYVPKEKLQALVEASKEPEQTLLETEDGERLVLDLEDENNAALAEANAAEAGGTETQLLGEDAVVLNKPPKKFKDPKEVVCARCYKLRYYGKVDSELRAGWSTVETLTPKAFEDTISVLRDVDCLVVYVTDIFDFHGSVLTNIRRLVGANEVIVAANKADLLPKDMKPDRVRQWITKEMRALGLGDVRNSNVHLISCFTGYGVKSLLRAVRERAAVKQCDVYVVGAANVGKSTFINKLVDITERAAGKKPAPKGKRNRGKAAADLRFGAVTTSVLPGTTLGMVRIRLDKQTSLYDTPGLMLSHQLTSRLESDELGKVVPQKRVDHVTLRLLPQKTMMLGALAHIDFVDGSPALFTAFVSNDVKVHPTQTEKVPDLLEKRIGDVLYPPSTRERYDALGSWVRHEVTIEGRGWNEAAKDIVLGGLGWVAVTGTGNLKIGITVPRGVRVGLREPLMPFEARWTTAKYTGVRSRKIGKKTKTGGRRN